MSSSYKCASCGVSCGMMGHGKCEKGEENYRLGAAGLPRRWHYGFEIPPDESVADILEDLGLDRTAENDPAVLRQAVVKLRREVTLSQFESTRISEDE